MLVRFAYLILLSTLIACNGGGAGGSGEETGAGSSNGGGGGGVPALSTNVTLSANTFVFNTTPIVTITATDEIFNGSTTVSVESFACTTLTLIDSRNVQCTMDVQSTGSMAFGKITINSLAGIITKDIHVVQTSPRSEDFYGFNVDGVRVKIDGGTNTSTIDNLSIRFGHDGGKLFASIATNGAPTAVDNISQACPEAGDEYFMILMSNKTFSSAVDHVGMALRLEFTSSERATVVMSSSVGESTDSRDYDVFCNANGEVALYTDNAIRITPEYSLVSNDKYAILADATNNDTWVGVGNISGTINNVSGFISGAGPYTFNDGGRYTPANTDFTSSLGTIQLFVGDLCDNSRNPLGGADRLFFKSRELITGGLATGLQYVNENVLYYELERLADGHGIIKGVYEGDSTLVGCVAKEKALQAGNDKIAGAYVLANGQLLISLTNESHNNTDFTVDQFYVGD